MTTEKINALIAQAVFGYQYHERKPFAGYVDEFVCYELLNPETGKPETVPDYAGSYAGMETLIAKLIEKNRLFHFSIHCYEPSAEAGRQYHAIVGDCWKGSFSAIDDSLPKAFALAVLNLYQIDVASLERTSV
jgi:hypothetical protein